MKPLTGHINLSPFYEFAASDSTLPSRDSPQLQHRYLTLRKHAVSEVPRLPGWYLWGSVNTTGDWDTIYLGKTGKQKTSSVYARIFEELLDERIAFWIPAHGEALMLQQAHEIYDGKYDRETRRTARKAGARFIIWIGVDGAISEAEIIHQEDCLIAIDRPTANVAHRLVVPNEDTQSIVNAINQEILRIAAPVVKN